MAYIGEQLKSFREAGGFSREALAERLGVTEQVVAGWETGNTLPDVDVLLKISNLFGVTVNDLVCDVKPSDCFSRGRAKRVRTAVILGVFWIIALALKEFLLPYLDVVHRETWNALPYAIARGAVLPAFYSFMAAFLVSILAIHGDFRTKSLAIQAVLIILGLAFTVFYAYFISFFAILPGGPFLYNTNYKLWYWLYMTPDLFYVVGALLFCGFNRKSASKRVA